jgi:hypothetical protein
MRFMCGSIMETVSCWLATLNLSEYANLFDEHGYDSLQLLQTLSAAEVGELASDCNMKKGHTLRCMLCRRC